MIIEIKDKTVYDIYLNGKWVAACGSWDNVIFYVMDMLRKGCQDDKT